MNGDTGTQQTSDGANWQFKQEGTAASPPPPTPTPVPQQTPVSGTPRGADQPEVPPLQPIDIIGAETALPPANNAEISWTASEFADHEKSPIWYGGLAIATIIIVVIVHFLTKDIVSIVAIITFAIAFGIVGSYKPKIVSYHLGPEGIQINGSMHSFAQFKSYGVQREGAFPSIVFLPMKRFMPPTVVYFPVDEGDDVLAVLNKYLPSGPVPQDFIDRALRHVRF